RRDASPVVCCEASAFGLPLIAPDIGGLSLWHGENGIKLRADASAVEYAESIASLWNDPVGYLALAQTARRIYEDRLNWDSWGRSMAEVFETVLRTRAITNRMHGG